PFSSWWTSAKWDHWRRRMREGRYLSSCFQCGKLNQNEKLSRRFKQTFGEAAWREATGRGPGRRPSTAPVVTRRRRHPAALVLEGGALPVLR
ncbi:MAG TPA: hypothetical protein VGF99_19325, partial [Myxococcota bacterium]